LLSKALDLIDEAASILRIRGMIASPDLREYSAKIAQVRREKESANFGLPGRMAPAAVRRTLDLDAAHRGLEPPGRWTACPV
jgi:ATP-dependent Clp protease ATP-binding subunit ClpA